MTSPVFRSKRHDTGISPRITFTPPPGTSWNLQEPGIAVRLIARLPTASTPKIDAPAVVVGPWAVRFDPAPADVNVIGSYDVEVEVTRANGKKVTLPTEGYLVWVIAADLNNV